MPLPKNISWVTFDVYGTLIDWETGIFEAFAAEAKKDGVELERDQVLERFHRISRQIEAGSYELYAEVLRRTAVALAKEVGWDLESSRSKFLPESIPRWLPFKEALPQLNKLAKRFKLGLIANVDDKLLGMTRRHLPLEFDLVVTAQQVRAYKPDPAHFNEFARRIGGKRRWVHVAASHHHDVVPCHKLKVPVIWVNRNKEQLEAGQAKPTAQVANLREAVKLIEEAAKG